MAEAGTLDSIYKIVGVVLPVITTVIGGFIWVVKRIEKGQNKLWKRYRKLSERHSLEMAEVTKQLGSKVDMLQCENFRSQCPMCRSIDKIVNK